MLGYVMRSDSRGSLLPSWGDAAPVRLQVETRAAMTKHQAGDFYANTRAEKGENKSGM